MTRRTDLQRPSKAQKLHQNMVKYRRAKRIQFVGAAMTGTIVLGAVFLWVFRFDAFLRWMTVFVEQTHPVFVFVGLLVFAVLIDRCIEWIGLWESSQKDFQAAQLEYKKHTATIEGGELSCALIEHQQGELTQSASPGELCLGEDQ